MRKLVLYIAMSLDGYIADPRGGVDWLAGQDGDSTDMGSYPAFIQTVDTAIMGYTTYRQIVTELSPDAWFYKGLQTYVMTHRQLPDQPEIAFTGESAAQLAQRLRRETGSHKDIWICGGADVARQFTEADLIDRYHLTVIPILLGGGIRLFSEENPTLPLRLLSAAASNGMTDLIYERRDSTTGKQETV